MATYPIRQLADNGGTAPFVPVTAPEAVQFPDGSNLNTFIGSVATIESNPVAANHAVGEFLCINGQVYEVIDAITAGDSISLGENVQVTNLGSQITALNNGLTTVKRVAFSKNVTYGAGAAGYDSINMASDVSADNVIAIQLFTASVSSMGGCSITPLYVDNNSLYWSYRANTAVNNVSITFLVSYLDN